MSSLVQHGRRRGSSKRVSSEEEDSWTVQPPDLRQVTVLSKAEWLRIRDVLNGVNKDQDSLREAAKQREALHRQSEEVVKLWSNTFAGQRQKTLEAKRIQEEIEEEKRKLTDKEEAEYQEQKRKEAIEKAKTQLFYQTDRVRGLHSALMLTEVMKEREAQMELKQRIKSASKDVDRDFLDTVKTREDEALKQEQEKALQEKLERQAVAEDVKHQIKKNELVREQKKIEDKMDAEETQRLQELYQREQREEEERRAKQKRNLMQDHLEHLANRELIRALDMQRQEAEEEQRKLFLSAKQKMMKLQKDREAELQREAQMCREKIMNELTVTQQEQTVSEEQRSAKAIAEQEAKRAQQQQDEEEKRTTMLKAIIAHGEVMRQEKEQRDKTAKQKERDTLQAKREADRIFSEKQQLKDQQTKEHRRKLQDFNATQMAEKSARQQHLRREQLEFDKKNAELIAEEELQFQQYSQQVIDAAVEAKRNVFALCKAARQGDGAGFGLAATGVRPRYLVQDRTDAQMPKYVSAVTQNIKELNEAVDIQDSKMRLGFTW
ncbi:cilia- and flagella- associated protein 210 [Chaetodon trifascialis]|uniref:cilia- and flagella- associated protein 210 n=1 Tax=Chaetodon trifascialis TaxID=109706 RepID=UPI003996A972